MALREHVLAVPRVVVVLRLDEKRLLDAVSRLLDDERRLLRVDFVLRLCAWGLLDVALIWLTAEVAVYAEVGAEVRGVRWGTTEPQFPVSQSGLALATGLWTSPCE